MMHIGVSQTELRMLSRIPHKSHESCNKNMVIGNKNYVDEHAQISDSEEVDCDFNKNISWSLCKYEGVEFKSMNGNNKPGYSLEKFTFSSDLDYKDRIVQTVTDVPHKSFGSQKTCIHAVCELRNEKPEKKLSSNKIHSSACSSQLEKDETVASKSKKHKKRDKFTLSQNGRQTDEGHTRHHKSKHKHKKSGKHDKERTEKDKKDKKDKSKKLKSKFRKIYSKLIRRELRIKLFRLDCCKGEKLSTHTKCGIVEDVHPGVPSRLPLEPSMLAYHSESMTAGKTDVAGPVENPEQNTQFPRERQERNDSSESVQEAEEQVAAAATVPNKSEGIHNRYEICSIMSRPLVETCSVTNNSNNSYDRSETKRSRPLG